jgi:predicted PurR-regulated permease PerM
MELRLFIPAGVWGTLLIALLVAAGHAGLHSFEYWRKKRNFALNNEVAGIIFSVLTLIYSLLVSFVIIAVWENYEELNQVVEKEADDLNSVLVHSSTLPDTLKNQISVAIKNYCKKVVEEEWNMMPRKNTYGQSAIPSLRLLLFRVEAESRIQENLLSVMDENLISIGNLRRERLSHTHSYVPELVWMILIISTIMVILFSYFLYIESEQLKKIFLSFLWTFIGMSLFLLYMLDHPFIGSTQVSKGPYEEIIKSLTAR